MQNTDLNTLGQRIKERRKVLGLTQEGLAAKAEIDRSYIGGVERGERNVTFTMLCSICVALDCDIAALTSSLPKIPQSSGYEP
jgi:transcriptional regulator with XRE-family HTH domain